MKKAQGHIKKPVWFIFGFILTLAFLILLVFIQTYFFVQGHMDPLHYKLSVGPFLEEAFKGGFVVFLFLLVLSLNPRIEEELDNKKLWLAAGMLIGLFVGLYETFVDYSPGLYRLIPTLNHALWATIVAGGIWFFAYASKHKFEGLVASYVGVSLLHGLWNYHAYIETTTGSEFTLGGISFLLTVVAFFMVWWKLELPKLQVV